MRARKLKGQELPWGPVVRTLCPSARAAGSILASGELRPHMPCSVAKKEKRKLKEQTEIAVSSAITKHAFLKNYCTMQSCAIKSHKRLVRKMG